MWHDCFLNIARNPINYLFFRPSFLKCCDTMSLKLLRPYQFLKIVLRVYNGPLSHINQDLAPTQCFSMLEEQQHGSFCRETVSDSCKQQQYYLDRGMGLRIYVKYCLKIWIKKKRTFPKTCFFKLKLTVFDVWGVTNGFITN